MTPRVVVMVSGSGTNLQALIDAARTGKLDIQLTGVVSNIAEAYALQRAAAANIPTVLLPHEGRVRSEYDRELASTVAEIGADFVVLAGWNRLLSSEFVSHYTTINLHPAKPGAFPGRHAIERAYDAFRRGEIAEGGAMVHYVPDEGIDDGPVIGWRAVKFRSDDTLSSYTERVQVIEHALLVECVAIVASRILS